MKQVLPVSVDQETIDWITSEVKRGKFRNRSHLVEEAIKELKKRNESERK